MEDQGSKETAKIEDLKCLENLFKDLKLKATESGPWTIEQWPDYLKAHGIINACAARDKDENRQWQIYNLESDWYRGDHPLTYSEFQVLTNKHKELLVNFRQETRAKIDKLKTKQKRLAVDHTIFSTENLDLASELCDEVFAMSEKCSDDFVAFSRTVIDSSVDVLSKLNHMAPCPFAVIGLGSVARGVVTPYSDLEYAFIVDSHKDNDYFIKLAVDTYFRIGNISESPIKTFNIKIPDIKSKTVVGYRIDGISDMAGNIPTGNLGGQSLILTVDELMELYRTSANSPLGRARPGGFSDLLSASALIYANGNGQTLHEELVGRLAEESKDARDVKHTIEKRLQTIEIDVDYFNFLPRYKTFGSPENANVQVKSDIFRFPSLITTHLGLLLASNSYYPWKVLSELQQFHENYRFLKIMLGLSILIRTTAYLALGSQSDHLSLYTSSTEMEADVYHMPQNVFVLLECLLIPIRQSIQGFLESHVEVSNTSLNVYYIVEQLLDNFDIAKPDFKVKAEVLYFAGDFDSSLGFLYLVAGKDVVNNKPDTLLSSMCQNENLSRVSEKTFGEMTCFLLLSSRKYSSAKLYLDWLVAAEPKELRWKILLADCFNKLHHYQDAVVILSDVVLAIRKELCLDSDDVLPHHLRMIIQSEQIQSDELLSLLEHTAQTYRVISDSYQGLKQLEEAEQTLKITIGVSEHLISCKPDAEHLSATLQASVGSLHFDRSQYTQALEHYGASLKKLLALHGNKTNQPDIAGVYSSIGRVYREMNRFAEAQKHYELSYAMQKAVHCNNLEHIDIAVCLNEIGSLFIDMNMSTKALDSFNKALSKFEKNEDLFGIVDCYMKIADAYIEIKDYRQARKYLDKALVTVEKKMKASKIASDSELASIYNKLGSVCRKTGENLEEAKRYHNIALDMIRAVHSCDDCGLADNLDLYLNMGELTQQLKTSNEYSNVHRFLKGRKTQHPDIACGFHNIGIVYFEMGSYDKSLERVKKALDMQKKVYGENGVHIDIAKSYDSIGAACTELGKYTESLKYQTKSLNMRRGIYGENAAHTDIAINCHNIGSVHYRKSEYDESLSYTIKSIDMMRDLYGKDAANFVIATSFNNIGTIYFDKGDYNKSLRYHIKSLDMRQILYGEDANHQEIAVNYSDIGNVYSKLNDHSKALEYHFESLKMREVVYRKESVHPDIADSYTNIGCDYFYIDQYDKSLEYFEKALDMVKRLHGCNTNHPDIASNLNNIGTIYYQLAEYRTSLSYHDKSLTMWKAIHEGNVDNRRTAESYNNIALAYLGLGEFDNALKHSIEALRIELSIYGEENPHDYVATSHSNIGKVYEGMKKYSKALKYHLKALKIRETLSTTPQRDLAVSYWDIGELYQKLGDHPKSLQYYIKSVSKIMEAINSENSFTAAIYQNIGDVYTASSVNSQSH